MQVTFCSLRSPNTPSAETPFLSLPVLASRRRFLESPWIFDWGVCFYLHLFYLCLPPSLAPAQTHPLLRVWATDGLGLGNECFKTIKSNQKTSKDWLWVPLASFRCGIFSVPTWARPEIILPGLNKKKCSCKSNLMGAAIHATPLGHLLSQWRHGDTQVPLLCLDLTDGWPVESPGVAMV